MTYEHTAAMLAHAQQRIDTGGSIPEDMRCQHPGKRCAKLRTIKRGGEMHRLCVEHRERANRNQWLVDQRRRQQRDAGSSRQPTEARRQTSQPPAPLRRAMHRQTSEPTTPSSPEMTHAGHLQETAHGDDEEIHTFPPLSDEDLHYLEALLCGEGGESEVGGNGQSCC